MTVIKVYECSKVFCCSSQSSESPKFKNKVAAIAAVHFEVHTTPVVVQDMKK